MNELAGKRVLIAEDDPIQSRVLGSAMQKAGAIVEIVGDGKTAHDRLLGGSYDALVTDWMMPELDGIELARLVRGTPNRPFVVLVSALSMTDARLHAMRAGADEFFAKPLIPPRVVECVVKGLKRHAEGGASRKNEEVAAAPVVGHPVARTEAWKGLPETLRRVVGDLLQIPVGVCVLEAPPAAAVIRRVLPLVDTEHRMELHLRIDAGRADAIELARVMLGEPVPDDDATLTDLVSEVANVAAGALKVAFAAEAFPFTLGLAGLSDGKAESDYALTELVGLRTDKMLLSVALGVRPQNAQVLAASQLREGMVLAESLHNQGGALTLPMGTRLTTTAVARLRAILGDRKIRVCVPVGS